MDVLHTECLGRMKGDRLNDLWELRISDPQVLHNDEEHPEFERSRNHPNVKTPQTIAASAEHRGI
jgi:hypothetical protein